MLWQIEESSLGMGRMPIFYKIKWNDNGKVDETPSYIIWLGIICPNISSVHFYIADVSGKHLLSETTGWLNTFIHAGI